ncbi:hypothetical protein [Aeromonas hydrophila]|uniref:hypothetical protein n=1 Tax=Aeromonas hydrophila TaxID=644 RepID=UPI003EC76069
MNVSEIFNIIKSNNGTISSYQLAQICGVDHSAFVRRMSQVLLNAERRDSMTMQEIHDKLVTHANVRVTKANFKSGNYGSIKTRTEYLLGERDACVIAMTYSYELQGLVYDAYQKFKDSLQQIASGAKNAKEIAIAALNDDFIEKVKSGKYQVGRYVRKMYGETQNPMAAYKKIMSTYDKSLAELFDKKSRKSFYDAMGKMFKDLKLEYRQTTPEKDFSIEMLAFFAAVEREVAERQRRVARHNQTRAENKLKAA